MFPPGESHGQTSLSGYSPWGRKGLDTTERLTHTHSSGEGFRATKAGSFHCCFFSQLFIGTAQRSAQKVTVGTGEHGPSTKLLEPTWTICNVRLETSSMEEGTPCVSSMDSPRASEPWQGRSRHKEGLRPRAPQLQETRWTLCTC